MLNEKVFFSRHLLDVQLTIILMNTFVTAFNIQTFSSAHTRRTRKRIQEMERERKKEMNIAL